MNVQRLQHQIKSELPQPLDPFAPILIDLPSAITAEGRSVGSAGPQDRLFTDGTPWQPLEEGGWSTVAHSPPPAPGADRLSRGAISGEEDDSSSAAYAARAGDAAYARRSAAAESAERAINNRVARQRQYMQNQLLARKSPKPAKFNGRTKCPLCDSPFRVGEEMVLCHASGAGAGQWVHVTCVNDILREKGMHELVVQPRV